jgi:hypothetical protein
MLSESGKRDTLSGERETNVSAAGYSESIETRSSPALARSFPRSFAFYVADPTSSIREQAAVHSMSG